jgi:hypothetical protein
MKTPFALILASLIAATSLVGCDKKAETPAVTPPQANTPAAQPVTPAVTPPQREDRPKPVVTPPVTTPVTPPVTTPAVTPTPALTGAEAGLPGAWKLDVTETVALAMPWIEAQAKANGQNPSAEDLAKVKASLTSMTGTMTMKADKTYTIEFVVNGEADNDQGQWTLNGDTVMFTGKGDSLEAKYTPGRLESGGGNMPMVFKK